MAGTTTQKAVVFALIAAIIVLSFLVLRPIIIAIFIGLLFAYFFTPIYKKINKLVKIPSLSSAILIVLIAIVLTIPLIYIIPEVISQTVEVYSIVQDVNIADTITQLSGNLVDRETATIIGIQFEGLTGRLFNSLVNQLTGIIANIPDFLLQFAIFLFTFFFAVRDSEKLKQYIKQISPFSKETEVKFFNEFRHITDGIIYGQVIVGIIQGLLLGIGLYVLGVPRTLFLTILAIIFSIIPIIGSWLVWVPASIIMFSTGNITGAIILFLYGLLFVSTIDNLLRPILLSKYSTMNSAIGIIGIIGGLYMFGIIGLVLGPLILAYLLIIVDFYRKGKFNEIFR